jgi:Holliday junction resolvasome RuvABC DNA-binding subunit
MKTALSRLVVSVLSLLTVVVALVTSVGKLLVTAIGLLTAALERAGEGIKSRRSTKNEAIEAPRANLRVLPTQSSKSAELTRALTGLGFQSPEVKRFVGSLSDDALKQDIRDLIKLGLKEMAA